MEDRNMDAGDLIITGTGATAQRNIDGVNGLYWREYDYCADWCARNGHNGDVGSPLPDYISGTVQELIDYDPEAFADRVRSARYAMAMNRLNISDD